MTVDTICKEYKLLMDTIGENKISPIRFYSELKQLEPIFKEEFYSNLENLETEQRGFYIKRLISFFENHLNLITFPQEVIDDEVKKEGSSVQEILGNKKSKLRAILSYHPVLHSEVEKIYEKNGIEARRIRIGFILYFMTNALTSNILFLKSETLSYPVKENNSNMEKIKLNISVAEMAILFRVLKDANIISKDVSAKKLTKLIATYFASKGSEQNSENSVSNKYYSDDVSKYRNVASLISKMDKTIENLIKKHDS